MEVERKFLVGRLPELAPDSGVAIEQGYLAIGADGSEVRLRRSGERLLLTAKRGRGLVRDEVEVELDAGRFDSLWPLTKGRRLRKTRYRVEHRGRTVELDVYAGELEGLRVGEVEFGSEAEAAAFEPPDWLGREVTGDPAYANQALAVGGAPPARA